MPNFEVIGDTSDSISQHPIYTSQVGQGFHDKVISREFLPASDDHPLI